MNRAQGWHRQDFKGTNDAEAEEDLAEVWDSWFFIIAEDLDIMPMIALTQHGHHENIAPYFDYEMGDYPTLIARIHDKGVLPPQST